MSSSYHMEQKTFVKHWRKGIVQLSHGTKIICETLEKRHCAVAIPLKDC